eukprot:2486793-Heterocapsa_arctica.AAC.1
MAPLLGHVAPDEADSGQTVVLVLGWGGSTPSQLEPVRRWWRGRGCATVAATRSPVEAEAQ